MIFGKERSNEDLINAYKEGDHDLLNEYLTDPHWCAINRNPNMYAAIQYSAHEKDAKILSVLLPYFSINNKESALHTCAYHGFEEGARLMLPYVANLNSLSHTLRILMADKHRRAFPFTNHLIEMLCLIKPTLKDMVSRRYRNHEDLNALLPLISPQETATGVCKIANQNMSFKDIHDKMVKNPLYQTHVCHVALLSKPTEGQKYIFQSLPLDTLKEGVEKFVSRDYYSQNYHESVAQAQEAIAHLENDLIMSQLDISKASNTKKKM